jgi:hypothetical protein
MDTAEHRQPDWRDESLGTRVRVALWLADQVGEGGRFKKEDLRALVGERDGIGKIEQVDRRMRDLRPAGWSIKTYRDMAGLKPDELFLEKIGAPVWEPEHRKAGLRNISARTRREVFERDGHRCRRCGIAAAEEYPDDPGSRARLTLGHMSPHKSATSADAGPEDLITECARCNETARHLTGPQLTGEQVWDRITELGRKEKARLLAWMLRDARTTDKTEELWAAYRQLPGVRRDRIKQELTTALAEELPE